MTSSNSPPLRTETVNVNPPVLGSGEAQSLRSRQFINHTPNFLNYKYFENLLMEWVSRIVHSEMVIITVVVVTVINNKIDNNSLGFCHDKRTTNKYLLSRLGQDRLTYIYFSYVKIKRCSRVWRSDKIKRRDIRHRYEEITWVWSFYEEVLKMEKSTPE